MTFPRHLLEISLKWVLGNVSRFGWQMRLSPKIWLLSGKLSYKFSLFRSSFGTTHMACHVSLAFWFDFDCHVIGGFFLDSPASSGKIGFKIFLAGWTM